MAMRTLTRYLGREVLVSTLVVFGGLLMLFAFFDVIYELRDVGTGSYGIGNALTYVVLHLPARAYELFPVSALIGTLFALSQLVASSEYTVMRVSGASLWQIGWAVVRVGIPLALATFLAGEFVAPPSERLAQTLRASARGDVSSVVAQQFDSGFWFKQDLTFVNVRSVLADLSIVGVRIYEFDADLRLARVRRAESGRFLQPGRWQLKDVTITEITGDSARRSSMPEAVWETVLRPTILTVYQVAPERLELGTLWDNIRVLSGNQQKTSRFEIAFWQKILYPLAVLVMMVLALPFAQFQARSGGVGVRIFTGTMLGLSFFLLGRLFSNLAVLNDWPPLFAAAFPVVVFVGIGIALLWWIERR
jgi:lipopolysaccharide export system permease protein